MCSPRSPYPASPILYFSNSAALGTLAVSQEPDELADQQEDRQLQGTLPALARRR